MSTPAERLRWAREAANFKTAADFIREHKLQEGTYRHHENGTRGIRAPTAARYSKLLKINANWLLTGEGSPREGVELSPTFQAISWAPKISWVQAGQLTEGFYNPTGEEEQIPVLWHRPTVALEVRGSSMNRVAQPGDLIIVDYGDRQPEDKKLYVFRCRGEMTFKRFRNTGGPVRLEPDSSESHETLFPDSDFEVVGRVIFVIRRT